MSAVSHQKEQLAAMMHYTMNRIYDIIPGNGLKLPAVDGAGVQKPCPFPGAISRSDFPKEAKNELRYHFI